MPPPAPARPGLWHEAPREARQFCLVTQGLTVEWVLGQSPCRPGTGAEQGPRVRGGRWEGLEDTPPTSAAPGGLGDTTSGRGQQGAEVQTPQAELRWDGAPSWRWRPAPQALPVGSVGGQRRAGPIGSGGAEPNVRARRPAPRSWRHTRLAFAEVPTHPDAPGTGEWQVAGTPQRLRGSAAWGVAGPGCTSQAGARGGSSQGRAAGRACL